jgi:hypothetical protein
MNGVVHELIETVNAITSVEDAAQLERLDHAISDYFAHPEAAAHLRIWFGLFERFPEDDAYEMFWSILHGIEALPNYETDLIASLRRRPSRFPVLMVNRMLNAGQSHAGGVDLMSLLESVTADETCPSSVREDAESFIEYQRRRA